MSCRALRAIDAGVYHFYRGSPGVASEAHVASEATVDCATRTLRFLRRVYMYDRGLPGVAAETTACCAAQFEAFARGFMMLCGGPAIHLFSATELERLVCGTPLLDFAALQRNARYEGGYSATHQARSRMPLGLAGMEFMLY